jgi:hypothetical protein
VNNPLIWSNWLKITTLIIAGVIIFALIRGCSNSKLQLSENNALKSANDSLSKKINNDSIANKKLATDYQLKDQVQSGIITIQENKLNAAYDTLDKANDRINKLLARYKPVTPNVDTNVTLVPNEYISDCSQCFTELEGQQNNIKGARKEMDSLKKALTVKINIQQARISELGREQAQAKNNLNDCRAINEAYQKKLELRRRLFLSMGIMAIGTKFTPNAAGIGLSYQDKQFRMISFKYYTSEYGGIKSLDIHMPLSLR